ncbi:MAG TPA: hypothetical protein VHX38_41725 [Pseudonocardiaceae bacterium]|jgi:hypothetical protein|nr:hypothetical protein [Pseudonocardiaceae bacterium]
MNTKDCRIAADYYERLNWHAGVFRSTVWVIAGRPVEALDIPEKLGRRVLTLLLASNVPGPVFQAPERTGTRWVFLTGRRDQDWYSLAARLTDLDVEHIWAGSTLDLPPSQIGNEHLTWLIPPIPAVLPPFSIIARAVLEAAGMLVKSRRIEMSHPQDE